MRLLMIDNYDSFTYNLVQYLGELGAEVEVVRNDVETVDSLLEREADGLVISPGPGTPDDAGVSMECVRAFAERGTPVLGVCLGHQSIGQVFGGRIVRAGSIMHGKTSRIEHDGRGVFAGLPQPFEATRYHSLVIEDATCPEVLEVVQFHPESILTGVGKQLLASFLAMCRSAGGAAA